MAKSKPLPPLEELQKVLSYDSETGIFTWIIRTSQRTPAGSVAGTIDSKGYRKIWFDGQQWLAHRLAWLFETGEDPGDLSLDHINRKKDDNRIENLRLATGRQQNGNQSLQVDNTSGFRGVSYNKKNNKWLAKLQIAGCTKFLGYFVLKEDAAAAYQKAAADHFGEFWSG
jgi:hypothetical protein